MKKILLLIFITNLFSQQAAVENVQVVQRTDGSKIVDITYDLLPDALFTEFNVTVEVSLDGGASWNITYTVLGDVFSNQVAANDKSIIWDMGDEFPNTFNENVQVRVIAEGSIMGPPPFEMVSVPAGDYTYSSFNEILTIDYDFEISKYEITNAQYVAYLLEALEEGNIYIDGPFVKGFYAGDESYDPGDQTLYTLGSPIPDPSLGRIDWNGTTFIVNSGFGDHPVYYTTWFGAKAFAEHYGMRLPDEYEWEKTARGNTAYDYPFGNSINNTNANYNYNKNGTTPVGYYNGENENTVDAPSPYGAYDMAGNVYEWTNSYLYPGSPQRIMRGGSWSSNDYHCVSFLSFSSSAHSGFGFRVATTHYLRIERFDSNINKFSSFPRLYNCSLW